MCSDYAASSESDWQQPLKDTIIMAIVRLRVAATAVGSFCEAHRKWQKTWYVKLLGAVAFVAAIATAAANLWGVRSMNHHVVPPADAAISRTLDREVCISQCGPFFALRLW